jgi:GNAT superfamily N-acetyltransferase
MEKPSIEIRQAGSADVEAVARFNIALCRETEGRELDPATVSEGVRRFVSEPARGRYCVALIGGEVVGQTAHTVEWSDWRNGEIWWIQSVYVAAEERGCGVFGALYRAVESEARANPGICGIRLYMEHHNARARAAYVKLGMKAAGYEVFETDFTRPV